MDVTLKSGLWSDELFSFILWKTGVLVQSVNCFVGLQGVCQKHLEVTSSYYNRPKVNVWVCARAFVMV